MIRGSCNRQGQCVYEGAKIQDTSNDFGARSVSTGSGTRSDPGSGTGLGAESGAGSGTVSRTESSTGSGARVGAGSGTGAGSSSTGSGTGSSGRTAEPNGSNGYETDSGSTEIPPIPDYQQCEYC